MQPKAVQLKIKIDKKEVSKTIENNEIVTWSYSTNNDKLIKIKVKRLVQNNIKEKNKNETWSYSTKNKS